jgi:hypothetical protein
VVKKNNDLQKAIDEVKQLRGFLPICSNCKDIRDDHGYWQRIETYISNHTEATFTDGICPDCAKALYSEFVFNNEDKVLFNSKHNEGV